MLDLVTSYKGQALLAGIIILAIEVALQRVSGVLRRKLSPRSSSLFGHWLPGAGGLILEQSLRLLWSLGAPLVVLFLGIFSTQDIGIPIPDWGLVLPWAGITIGCVVVWVGWLWGRHWITHPEERPLTRTPQSSGLPGLLVHVLSQEGYFATARGALMPVLGTYWGVWVAVLAKVLAAFFSPGYLASLRNQGKRDLILLDWTSDLVGGALFVLTGSIIITSAARFVLNLVMWLLVRWLPARARVSG